MFCGNAKRKKIYAQDVLGKVQTKYLNLTLKFLYYEAKSKFHLVYIETQSFRQ